MSRSRTSSLCDSVYYLLHSRRLKKGSFEQRNSIHFAPIDSSDTFIHPKVCKFVFTSRLFIGYTARSIKYARGKTTSRALSISRYISSGDKTHRRYRVSPRYVTRPIFSYIVGTHRGAIIIEPCNLRTLSYTSTGVSSRKYIFVGIGARA